MINIAIADIYNKLKPALKILFVLALAVLFWADSKLNFITLLDSYKCTEFKQEIEELIKWKESADKQIFNLTQKNNYPIRLNDTILKYAKRDLGELLTITGANKGTVMIYFNDDSTFVPKKFNGFRAYQYLADYITASDENHKETNCKKISVISFVDKSINPQKFYCIRMDTIVNYNNPIANYYNALVPGIKGVYISEISTDGLSYYQEKFKTDFDFGYLKQPLGLIILEYFTRHPSITYYQEAEIYRFALKWSKIMESKRINNYT